MKTTDSNFKIYKICYRYHMADLFQPQGCLLGEEVLDNVFVRDFLQQKEIPFMDKGKRFIRHYQWEPQGGVTRIKIGYKEKSKFVGAIVLVNYSRLNYEPYVVIIDRDKAFANLDTVADMVARALSWAFKGNDIVLQLVPWQYGDDGEIVKWGYDCMLAHMLGDGKGALSSQAQFGLETCVNNRSKKHAKKQEVSPPEKKNTKEKKTLRDVIIYKSKADALLQKISDEMQGKTEPWEIMMPTTAAIAAEAMDDPSFSQYKNSFPEVKFSSTSFYRLRNPECKFYKTRLKNIFNRMVEEMKAI